MKTTKENIKESINKLEIAQSRLEDNPNREDIGVAMKIIIEVFNTLEEIRKLIEK